MVLKSLVEGGRVLCEGDPGLSLFDSGCEVSESPQHIPTMMSWAATGPKNVTCGLKSLSQDNLPTV